ncbi:hypothetical protein GR925_05835 [Streptomyces sp. HUCO-GS316]|uniref:hypothetical protein n=1 Tax=Streptomyces sp. HUCO-GS316 TaxID=2692198 RepID=UPI00136FBF35|nr:hypothetical protein [Streptomyces sp. HUCO-GS316]MXM62978.1 hypothetical protein [Streptomyces sp. HUCO-GS316]
MTVRHHTARSPNGLLLTATVLVTTAALLRLLSPDGEADAGPRPKSGSPHSSSPHSSSPNRCAAGFCADAGRR